jgi:hypothetical protein
MIGHRIRVFALGAAAIALLFAAPAHAAPFDGAWKRSLVTTDGHCGVISVDLAGVVSGSGQAHMNGVAGPRKAEGNGRFTRSKAKGDWNGVGPSGVCSGYWIAVPG